MTRVAALLPLDRTRPPPALDALPMGRAARVLLDEGIEVVLADAARDGRVCGYRATPDGWERADDVEVCGVYDRFPMPTYPERHAELLAALVGVNIGNPRSLRALSRDKWDGQHHLEARGVFLPPIEEDPSRFSARLAEWGVAFVKPRFGAGGVGVRRVSPGAVISPTTDGVTGESEPTLLQRAVIPPDGWAGIAARTLVQRDTHGDWVCSPAVARRSRTDAVVNVARGASADPAQDVLDAHTLASLYSQVRHCAAALADHPDGELLLELGIDAMIDADGAAVLIEVNTRPWGRLSALYARDPARWSDAHIEACARPFRYLAAMGSSVG